MVDLNSITKLKEQVKQLELKKEQAKGRAKQLLKNLKEQFGCANLKQAKSTLATKKKELKTLEKKYNGLMQNFLEKWEEKLV